MYSTPSIILLLYITSDIPDLPTPSSTSVSTAPSELFNDSEVIYPQEGITQGDPIAMPMYAYE